MRTRRRSDQFTKEKRTLVNTVALHRLRAAKGGNQELTDTELAQLDVEVQYECICQRGTFGAFCDESEADRSCQEVYCLGRGKGKSGRNGTCSCQCEKQFFGERCEQLSACFDTRCENGGICEDVVDWKLKTVTASCECPKSVEIVKAKVSGETCGKLEIPTTTDKQFIPCETSSNSSQFYKKLLTTIDLDFMNDISELEAIRDDYHDGMSTSAQMNEGWCRNGGKCVPQVIRVRSNRFYYIPSCECTDPLSDGIYCEYKRKDGCSLTRDEVARGARADEKCTDMQHGACVDIMGKATCV
uniref:EGF-like domain-containing protein n=1 Tax=Caenorhabditis japonica TaxID=281687 RepID=A0A8R1DUQ0_CAEJA